MEYNVDRREIKLEGKVLNKLDKLNVRKKMRWLE